MKVDPSFYSLSGTRQELLLLIDQALWAERGMIGYVARGLQEGYTEEEIAESIGPSKGRSVAFFVKLVGIIRGDISLKSVGSMTRKRALAVVDEIDSKSDSRELKSILADLRGKIERYNAKSKPKNDRPSLFDFISDENTFDEEGQNDVDTKEMSEIELRTVADRVIAKSAVYVYSYPKYLATMSPETGNRALFKIGASKTVTNRIARQRRQTEVPEDLILLRTFYCDNPFEIEAQFHKILTSIGLNQKTTLGGIEWFDCSIETIDAIAESLGVS